MASPAAALSWAKKPRLRSVLIRVRLWGILFFICLGLGYPTLGRYDPRQFLPDSAAYAKLAEAGSAAVGGVWRFRVLVPMLARPIYHFAAGHTGGWDPLVFSFLIVNSFFTASTAWLLFEVGRSHLDEDSQIGVGIPLLGSTLFLLNFAVANSMLAGLVDAAEAFFLMVAVACMYYQLWRWLPLLGILGALAKDSFVPFSILMALVWWRCSADRRMQDLLMIAAMGLAEFLTLIAAQSWISGHAIWPWASLTATDSPISFFLNLGRSLIARNFWYVFVWLLPLGLVGIRKMPNAWTAAAVTASTAAWLLNAYHVPADGGSGNLGRYVFDVAGPLLSLSAAVALGKEWPISAKAPPM